MSTTSALLNKAHTGLRDEDTAELTKAWDEKHRAIESAVNPLLEPLKNDINTLFATLEEGPVLQEARSRNLLGTQHTLTGVLTEEPQAIQGVGAGHADLVNWGSRQSTVFTDIVSAPSSLGSLREDSTRTGTRSGTASTKSRYTSACQEQTTRLDVLRQVTLDLAHDWKAFLSDGQSQKMLGLLTIAEQKIQASHSDENVRQSEPGQEVKAEGQSEAQEVDPVIALRNTNHQTFSQLTAMTRLVRRYCLYKLLTPESPSRSA